MSRKQIGFLAALAVIILVLLAVIYGLTLQQRLQEYNPDGALGRLMTYCIDVKFNPPAGYGVEHQEADCVTWSSEALAAHRDTVLRCHGDAGPDDARFKACLVAEVILPPGVVPA